ncbi:hypothetical protein M798_16250 [Brucella melitensis ADMAS-G1]|nr:hypothetical protein M798_16250 [Brucella melitensis ADMAS-G1]
MLIALVENARFNIELPQRTRQSQTRYTGTDDQHLYPLKLLFHHASIER